MQYTILLKLHYLQHLLQDITIRIKAQRMLTFILGEQSIGFIHYININYCCDNNFYC